LIHNEGCFEFVGPGFHICFWGELRFEVWAKNLGDGAQD